MYSGLSQVYCIKPEGKIISIQKIKQFIHNYLMNSEIYYLYHCNISNSNSDITIHLKPFEYMTKTTKKSSSS